MAVNTELDTLVLNIEVNDKKNGESASQKITALQRSLTRLQSSVQRLDTATFRTKFSAMATAIKPFISQLNKAKGAIGDVEKLAKRLDTKNVSKALSVTKIGTQKVNTNASGTNALPQSMSGTAQQLATETSSGLSISQVESTYGRLSKSITDANGKQQLFFERIEGNNRIITKFTADLDKNGKVIEKSLQKVNEVSQNAAGNGLKSFFLSIKRIALYRAIRTTLKTIVSGTKEGIRNITAFDAGYRQTMTQLTSSFTIMQNSLGAVVMPLLQLVTPLVQGIAKAVGTLANGISYLAAKLKGQSSWVKVNIDYLKEYNKQVNKLSYDEFSVLSGTDDTSGMFTEESMSNMSKGLIDDLRTAEVVIGGIAAILAGIAVSKLAAWIGSGGIKNLIDGLKGVKDGVKGISAAGLIAATAFSFVTALVNLIEVINNWNSQSLITKISAITAAVLGLAAVVFAIMAAIPGWGFAKIAKALAVGLTAGTMLAGAISVIKFADGGMLNGMGTMYAVAGESGAEIVATGSRGTGVANVQQIEEAFYNALYKYNAAKQSQAGGDVVISLDGRELARQNVRNNADALRQNYNIKLEPR